MAMPVTWEMVEKGDFTDLEFWDDALGGGYSVYKDCIKYAARLGLNSTAGMVQHQMLRKIIDTGSFEDFTRCAETLACGDTVALVPGQTQTPLELLSSILREAVAAGGMGSLVLWMETYGNVAVDPEPYGAALALAVELNKTDLAAALLRSILCKAVREGESRRLARCMETYDNVSVAADAYDAALTLALELDKMDLATELLCSILCKAVREGDANRLGRCIENYGIVVMAPEVYDAALALAVELNKTNLAAALVPRAYANTLRWGGTERYPGTLSNRAALRRKDDGDWYGEFDRVLTVAYVNQNATLMELLLRAGAAPHVWVTTRQGGRCEGPLVYAAAAKGQIDLVRLLLDHGAEVDDHDSYTTPLYAAVEEGHYDVAKMLTARGADPNIFGYRLFISEETPRPDLMGGVAIERGSAQMLELLLRHDMDINLLGHWNGTFLDAALHRTLEEPDVGKAMVDLLLACNIDFDIQDAEITCFDPGDDEAARIVVPLDELPPDVRKMLDDARHHQSLAHLQSLTDSVLNTQDAFGKTALHRAAENGQIEQVRYLIGRRASPFIRDMFGRRPHESAKHRWETYRYKRDKEGIFDEMEGGEFYDSAVQVIMDAKQPLLREIYELCVRMMNAALPEHNTYLMIVRAYQNQARLDARRNHRNLRRRYAGRRAPQGDLNFLINLPEEILQTIVVMGTGIGYEAYKAKS